MYYKAVELVLAWAIALKEKWCESEEATIMNVYAPNNRSEHPGFWERLELGRGSRESNRPDFPLGDFHVMEVPIDRALIHRALIHQEECSRSIERPATTVRSGGYMETHELCFTYHGNGNGQQVESRLDRIYVAAAERTSSFDWKLLPRYRLTTG